MRQINLLPPQLRETQATRRLVISTVSGLIVGAALAGLAWGPMRLEVQNLSAARSAPATTVSAKPDTDAKEKADLALRVTQLNTLSKGEIEWRRAFTLVGSIVPQDIRLTGFTYAISADTVSLKWGGTAPSNLAFASFVQSLQGNISLTGVAVDTYTYDPATGTVSFSLSATVPLDKITYQQAS